MTNNDDLQRTPHPERGGGSIASPGVKGERGGVGNENTHHGIPLQGGGGGSGTPPTQGGGKTPAVGGRRGPTLGRGREDEPPSIQQGTRDHPLTHVDRKEPPLTWMDGERDEGRGEDNQKSRPVKSSRQPHMSRELRMLDHSDEPLTKRVQRPAREMDYDNSCEVTRDSNMICPITCGCHNSLLDISKKPE